MLDKSVDDEGTVWNDLGDWFAPIGDSISQGAKKNLTGQVADFFTPSKPKPPSPEAIKEVAPKTATIENRPSTANIAGMNIPMPALYAGGAVLGVLSLVAIVKLVK